MEKPRKHTKQTNDKSHKKLRTTYNKTTPNKILQIFTNNDQTTSKTPKHKNHKKHKTKHTTQKTPNQTKHIYGG